MLPMGLASFLVILNTNGIIRTKLNLGAHNATCPGYKDKKYAKYFDREELHGASITESVFPAGSQEPLIFNNVSGLIAAICRCGSEPRPWERPSQIPHSRDPQGGSAGRHEHQSR